MAARNIRLLFFSFRRKQAVFIKVSTGKGRGARIGIIMRFSVDANDVSESAVFPRAPIALSPFNLFHGLVAIVPGTGSRLVW